MNSRPLIGAMAILAVAALTTACSPGGGGSGSESGSTSGQTLTVWYNSADSEAQLAVYERYEEESGNTLNLVAIPADGFENQVTTKWATGDRPDILRYHSTSLFLALNPAKNLQDLSDQAFASHSGEVYKSGAASYDGKTYGAVTTLPTQFGIYYNKDVLAKAGVEAPQTFEDIEAACVAIRDALPDVTPLWESGGSSWPTQILPLMYLADANKGNAYADDLLSQDESLADPDGPLVAAIAEYDKLREDGCFNSDITTAKFEDSVRAVADGTAAMVALHSAVLPMFNEALGGAATTDAKIGWANPSTEDSVSVWSPPMATYAPKTGDADREAAALDFIDYLTGDGYQQFIDEAALFPIIEGAKDPAGAQELMITIKDAYLASASPAFNSNLVGFNATFDKTMGQVIAGQLDPEGAGELSQQQLEQGAQTAGLPGW
ncbi:raffinose/stachyose/melibiose transport system substrate-binding protein [Microbacterium sp. W4I4]|uniref:ABC transporter substrate-binding protein n=1 Tax=Microbacterium sp. W4I4 TaxID=3042295 RepID=UPI00277D2A2D|nr:extracellular solute-binding protein [Microbacterium sp. W4I4]MDQ0613993.1 raffinose/stachyose/melibiose transport system substrate-binding protein [Microbacterium sp. W4I4]